MFFNFAFLDAIKDLPIPGWMVWLTVVICIPLILYTFWLILGGKPVI